MKHHLKFTRYLNSQFNASLLAHQCPIKKRKTDIHPVVDVGMVVVEFLVAVADAGLGEALGEDARALVDVVLVAPAAVDGDAAQ